MIVPLEIVLYVTIISNKNNLLVIITNMFLLWLKCIFTCMCMHVCVYAYVHAHIYVYVCMCGYVYVRMCIYMCVCVILKIFSFASKWLSQMAELFCFICLY